jgi:hypothetical protein
MRRLALALLFAVATSFAALTGCSSSDGEISVQTASSPLTAEGNDKLFTIKIVQARDGGYALDGLVVKATPDGKDAITVACTPNDTNGNKALDKDETLDCSEAATNQFDTTLAGTDVDVVLYAQIDNEQKEVGSATWTPPK